MVLSLMSAGIQSIFQDIPEAVKILAVFVCAALGLFIITLVSRKRASKDENPAPQQTESEQDGAERNYSLPNPAPLHPEDEQHLREYLSRIAGKVTLIDTDERSAAVIMAIIAHELGTEPDKLIFTSIRFVREPLTLEGVSDSDAAVVMAVTSYILGIPLERLMFKSIKCLED